MQLEDVMRIAERASEQAEKQAKNGTRPPGKRLKPIDRVILFLQ